MTSKTTTSRRRATIAALVLAAAALPGCSSVGKMFGSSSDSSSDLLAGANASAAAKTPDFECPSVDIRAGASTLAISVPGKPAEGAALDLRYQGTIVRTARECNVNGNVVNMRVGIEGRIVTGPAGGPGQIDVPIRVAVVEEGPNPKTITTKLYRTVVVIPPDQGNSNFTYVAEDISFPMPRAADIDKYIVYLGFDPQAEKPRPAPARKPVRRARPQG